MAICNITVENDADFYQVFYYKTLSGMPINMTGWTLLIMLRKHAADVEAQLRLGTDTGEIVLIDPPNGAFTVRIAQDHLLHMSLGDFDHSLIGTSAGYKRSIWTGTLTNNPGPSR
jgi:hypothetical protein